MRQEHCRCLCPPLWGVHRTCVGRVMLHISWPPRILRASDIRQYADAPAGIYVSQWQMWVDGIRHRHGGGQMQRDFVLAAGGDGMRRFVGFSGAYVVPACRQGSARVFRRQRVATAASENRAGPPVHRGRRLVHRYPDRPQRMVGGHETVRLRHRERAFLHGIGIANHSCLVTNVARTHARNDGHRGGNCRRNLDSRSDRQSSE